VQGARNFANKLWNATRFGLGSGATVEGELPTEGLSTVDRWVLSRLQHVIGEVDQQFEAYELAKVCDTLYHFAWDDVCDWYLELTKPVLTGDDEAAKAVTRRVLGHVLEQLQRLLHPIMPFVTEELWTTLTGRPTVLRAAWPAADKELIDDAAEREVDNLQRVVTEVRRFRSDQGVKPAQRVVARLDGLDAAGLAAHEGLIRSLARLDAARPTSAGTDFAATAKLAVGVGVTVELDTRGAIDVAAERARLAKDRAAAEKEGAQCRAKLGNPAFTDKAPEAVVAKIRQRLEAAEADLTRIAAQLGTL